MENTIPQNNEVPTPITPVKTNREILYETAVSLLGKDASPEDKVADELACAETVNAVYFKAFGKYITSPGYLTTDLYKQMKKNVKDFCEVKSPLFGDIIISPTGYGNGKIPHGHVGIVAKHGILSNDSLTGFFLENYTIDSWTRRFKNVGGYPIYYFRCL